ncbi:S8 family serine peptidase [candidate division TA06 bacterium]|nr:S8 family serine peptidase [candidate division TA06 bacterium]
MTIPSPPGVFWILMWRLRVSPFDPFGMTAMWDIELIGTSMSCPHVAGLVALMLSKNPSLTPAELDSIMEMTALDLGTPGKDNTFGAGRIDCCAAINAVPPLATPWIGRLSHQIDDSGGNNDGVWDAGETIDLIVTLMNVGANATNVQAELSAGGDPLVTLVDSSATFGNIAQGDSADNSSNPYVLTLDLSACPGYTVYFTLNITADPGFSRDVFFSVPTGSSPASSADHNAWNGIFTITENGALGFEDIPPAPGQGFRYPGAGTNWLYYGAFAIGNSSSYVADRFYGEGDDFDVILCDALTFGQTVYSDQDGLVNYIDSGHPAPRSVKVTQDSWAWSDPNIDDFVIMRYTIQNEGISPVSGLYVGQFMDYDIPDFDAQNNQAEIVPGDNLAYMYHATNLSYSYVGVCLLDPTPSANLSVIDHDLYVYPPGEPSEQTKINFLNGTYSFPSSNRPFDWSIVVSAGPFNLGPGQSQVVAFAILGANDLADLQTHCQRADSLYDTTVGVEESTKQEVQRSKFALHQNFPNPFSALGRPTAIRYSLLTQGEVTLKVYDISGRMVRTLVNGKKEAGPHVILWDGRDELRNEVSSGIYFYRIEAGDLRATKKLTLLK